MINIRRYEKANDLKIEKCGIDMSNTIINIHVTTFCTEFNEECPSVM